MSWFPSSSPKPQVTSNPTPVIIPESEMTPTVALINWISKVSLILGLFGEISPDGRHDAQKLVVDDIINKFKSRTILPPPVDFCRYVDAALMSPTNSYFEQINRGVHKIAKSKLIHSTAATELTRENNYKRCMALMKFLTTPCDESVIKAFVIDLNSKVGKYREHTERIIFLSGELQGNLMAYNNATTVSAAFRLAEMGSERIVLIERMFIALFEDNQSAILSLRSELAANADEQARKLAEIEEGFDNKIADLQIAQEQQGKTQVELGKTQVELAEAQLELGKTQVELAEAQLELGKTQVELAEAQLRTELFQLWSITKTDLLQVYNQNQINLLHNNAEIYPAIEEAYDIYKATILAEATRDAALLVTIQGIFHDLASQLPPPFELAVQKVLTYTVDLLHVQDPATIFDEHDLATETQEAKVAKGSFGELQKNIMSLKNEVAENLDQLRTVGPNFRSNVFQHGSFVQLYTSFSKALRDYQEFYVSAKIYSLYGYSENMETKFDHWYDEVKGAMDERQMKALILSNKRTLLLEIQPKQPRKDQLDPEDLKRLILLNLYCNYIVACCNPDNKKIGFEGIIDAINYSVFTRIPQTIIEKLTDKSEILGILDPTDSSGEKRKLDRGSMKYTADEDHNKALFFLALWIHEHLSPFKIYVDCISIKTVTDYRKAYITILNTAIRENKTGFSLYQTISTRGARTKTWKWKQIMDALNRGILRPDFVDMEKPFKSNSTVMGKLSDLRMSIHFRETMTTAKPSLLTRSSLSR